MRSNKERKTVIGEPVNATISRKGKIKLPDAFLGLLGKGNKMKVRLYCMDDSLIITKNELENCIANAIVSAEKSYERFLDDRLKEMVTGRNDEPDKSSTVTIGKGLEKFSSLRIGSFFVPKENRRKLCYKASNTVAYDCTNGVRYYGDGIRRHQAGLLQNDEVYPVLVSLGFK